MIRSQQWCIQQIPEGGYRLARVLGKKKGAVIFDAVIETERVEKMCRGVLHFSLTPQEYHLFTDRFPQLKPDLLDLQIKKRFADMGLSVDPASLIHTKREVPGRNGYYNSIFLPENDLNENLEQLSETTGISRCNLIPTAAAIAGLVRTVTEKAVLVLWIGMRFSQVLVVKNGIPLYNQSLAQTGPGEVEQALIPNAIDFARITIKKDHDIEEFKVLALGPGRDKLQLKEMEIEQWVPDFSKTIQTANPQDVFYYPHLFGAYFAASEYNFLPKEFARTWLLQRISKNIALGTAAAALALLGGWFYYQPILENQEKIYTSTVAELNQQRQSITNRIPGEEVLDNFARLLAIRSHAEKEFRLDQLTLVLSHALPANVWITGLTMKRKDAAAGDSGDPATEAMPASEDPANLEEQGNLSMPEKLQGKPFIMSLSCISEGSYGDVTTRFKRAASTLNNFFTVDNLTWNYREADRSGTIHCDLSPLQEANQ